MPFHLTFHPRYRTLVGPAMLTAVAELLYVVVLFAGQSRDD